MKKMKTAVPGETSSNWRKNKKGFENGVELNLYAPKDSNPEDMEEMIKSFPMEEIQKWMKDHSYNNLIVIDPT